MALIKELDRTLPAYYTLSNQKLILCAHVRDETVFFYDQLGAHTTVVLLSQPQCYGLKKIFLDLANDLGTTVIDLREPETFDPDYRLSDRSIQIICTLLAEQKFQHIITHPLYSADSDPQNRALTILVTELVKRLKLSNHYTYNNIGLNGTPRLPCGIQEQIIQLYCRVTAPSLELDTKLYTNYRAIASQISGIRKL
jgi:hypothetical protein